ncbi:hypothetical protein [Streptomyces sp. NPDC056527]|uniref:hypothetical protein n=1 Tax=Streptomyces sp. NPDC056527 TaxID=3345853 RepID=UPI00369E6820
MSNDEVAQQETRWVVLVEAETRAGYDDYRWHLAQTHTVEQGGRAAADELARTLAMEYVPDEVEAPARDTLARKVFRVADGSWLVEAGGGIHKKVLCRISVAELVLEQKSALAPYEPEPKDDTAASAMRLPWRRN